MPSRSESRQRRMMLALVLAIATSIPVTGRVSAQQPQEAEIKRALETVKADPNLATTRKVGTLKWRDPGQQPRTRPGWATWIVGLFRWLDQTSRALVWAVVAFLAGLLVVFVARVLRVRDSAPPGPAIFVAPSHVQDLDIRPESLPSDIGAAARVLWDRNERRAALALLYRGTLSRLVHVHRVPIRDSTTEGDCLVLAGTHLSGERAGYTSRLVGAWQRAVYGREEIQAAAVYDLCDAFATMLDAASPRNMSGAAS